MTRKELEIGKDYYSIFGNDESGTKKLIYNGENSWTAIDGERTMTQVNQKMTEKALEYINQPSYSMGSIGGGRRR